MRIFALGDPHLSFNKEGNEYKPMDIFGYHWHMHAKKIKKNWEETVSDTDIVLVPGDISWAIKLEEALPDLYFLGQLPGKKILIKGNHDLWWQSLNKVRKALPQSMEVIQNDSIFIENKIAICGTRGWLCPGDRYFKVEKDAKIYEREVRRLQLSLESVKNENMEKIVMLHYPPTNGKHEASDFIEVLKEHKIKKCIYAHLHAESIKGALPEKKWEINFHLVSADAIKFTPRLILENNTID